MKAASLLVAALLVSAPAYAKKPKVHLPTYSVVTKGAPVTVVHAGADWCTECVAMSPEWHKFENAYKARLNVVHINMDEKSTPEYKKYGSRVLKESPGLPLTFWIDSKGKLLDKKAGPLNAEQLGSMSKAALEKNK